MPGRPLTEREIEVVRLVADGKTNSQIADALEISPQTIKNHLTTIFDKTGTYSRGGLWRWMREDDLLQAYIDAKDAEDE